jgi:hypothetical protein
MDIRRGRADQHSRNASKLSDQTLSGVGLQEYVTGLGFCGRRPKLWLSDKVS